MWKKCCFDPLSVAARGRKKRVKKVNEKKSNALWNTNRTCEMLRHGMLCVQLGAWRPAMFRRSSETSCSSQGLTILNNWTGYAGERTGPSPPIWNSWLGDGVYFSKAYWQLSALRPVPQRYERHVFFRNSHS